MKSFEEAIKDGFTHVTDITDPEQLAKLRKDAVQIDSEGYRSFLFGPNKEFELRFEPILAEGCYQVCLYSNDVLLTEKVPMKAITALDLDKM